MIETRFKDTEVGRIPKDWDLSTIEVIATITTGSQNTQDHKENGKYPFYVRSQQVEHIDNWIFDTEGVVTAGDGVGTGKVFHYVNGKFGLHQRCYLIYQFKESIDARFFFWMFSNSFYERVHSMTAKSSVDSVRREMIADMSVPIPPINEQIRIATALSNIDALISELDKLLEKKQAIKQGAMQQLLTGKKRLKGFSEPWIEKKLGENATILRGGSPRPIEDYITDSQDGLNWIKIGDVKPGDKFFRKTSEKIKKEGLTKTRLVKKGDFILSNSMSFGRPYILDIDGCIHDGWLVIQDYQEAYDMEFLYYILCSDAVMNQYISMAAGSSVQNLNKEKVANVLLFAPTSLKEQSAIATILSSMDEEISVLEAKKIKYQQIKQGMMQQLLTGKIRLIK